MSSNSPALQSFHWTPQPLAARLIEDRVDACRRAVPAVAQLSNRMYAETGTRLVDWVDHLALNEDGASVRASGFIDIGGGGHRLAHPGGRFPDLVLGEGPRLAIKVESVADFRTANGIDSPITGDPGAPLRRMVVTKGGGWTVEAIERHGWSTLEAPTADAKRIVVSLRHHEGFRSRRRSFSDDGDGFANVRKQIEAAVKDLGRDWACDRFFAAEREYWQRRNRAGWTQKSRQDTLGLGWANHDHHTYRSSRERFKDLIWVLELLGFLCRERFYAGAGSGWGAQVLEQPATGIVIFADVDLSPEELQGDFAHKGLPARQELGTIGLWCALHGEAFLQAGMHHLEATFDYTACTDQLKRLGIESMEAFTDLPHLKQRFTIGERWAVRSERAARLAADGRITQDQANQFAREGALGSHLEILERNDGFKGFNQQGVDAIIAQTDPRRGG